MITITALKWVSPFAQGQVRDHRVRWVLNEVGWPYQVRLPTLWISRLPSIAQSSRSARSQFGGRRPATAVRDRRHPAQRCDTRAGRLLPPDDGDRALVVCCFFAALNSLEPPLANLAEVDFFIEDEELKSKRRPDVVAAVKGLSLAPPVVGVHLVDHHEDVLRVALEAPRPVHRSFAG